MPRGELATPFLVEFVGVRVCTSTSQGKGEGICSAIGEMLLFFLDLLLVLFFLLPSPPLPQRTYPRPQKHPL